MEADSVVGLVGGNAAGKTTTIKAVLGLVGIEAGEVRLYATREL